MTWFDVLLLVLVLSYCTYIIFGKKKRGCCSNCANCSGCGHKEKK